MRRRFLIEKTERLTYIDQILHGAIWSPRFPVNRTERLEGLAHDPLPKQGGIYRIHMERVWPLAYVGQSKDLRRRVNELRGVYDSLMPFTDPHVAGPALYAWRQCPPHRAYTVSFALIPCSAYWRQGFEDLVIAHHRWDLKRIPPREEQWRTFSPLANFGKLPIGWESSSTHKSGYRGGKVPFSVEEGLTETALAGESFGWTPSIAPISDLNDSRDPLRDLGWGGHQWTSWSTPAALHIDKSAQGLYRLRRNDTSLLFIGEGNLFHAAHEAARAARRTKEDQLFSYVVGTWPSAARQELKTDLLGLYLRQTGDLPTAQYGGEENEGLNSSKQFFANSINFLFSRLLPAQPAYLPAMAVA